VSEGKSSGDSRPAHEASGMETAHGLPRKQGLYDPRFERDACGVGFVVDIKGRRSRTIIDQALSVLCNLDHRGARGAEETTGDGAGLLMQLPHEFFMREARRIGFDLPQPGEYGVGMVFLPQEPGQRRECERIVNRIVHEEGQELLGWRTVPTDGSGLGRGARLREPVVRQVFVGRVDENLPKTDALAFERKLYVIRRRAENEVREARQSGEHDVGTLFYFPSFSSRTIVYKGMLLCSQLEEFYPDLRDADMRWRWCIRASAPTPSRAGTARTPTAT
jgi:glutamate synthase (NADPH) large chain